jgi:hypothetical protein
MNIIMGNDEFVQTLYNDYWDGQDRQDGQDEIRIDRLNFPPLFSDPHSFSFSALPATRKGRS